MGRKSIFIFIFFFPLLSFATERRVIKLDFESSIGCKSCKVNEIVYEENQIVSDLVWQQIFTPYVSMNVFCSAYKFHFDTLFETSVPVQTGFLEDYDYLNSANIVSNYSRHDLYVDKDFSIQFQLSYDLIDIKNKYIFSPQTGVVYQNRKFCAQNGFLQYPEDSSKNWTGNEEKTELSGIVISYEQSFWHLYLGFENTFIFKNTILKVSGSYYPYISVDSIDSHYLRSVQFFDSMQSMQGFDAKVSFSKLVNDDKKIWLTIRSEYDYFFCEGDSYSNVIGATTKDFALLANAGSATRNSALFFSIGLFINLK